MKQVCIRCLHKDKTPKMCAKRRCHNFDYEIKANSEITSDQKAKVKWPIWSGDIIKDESLQINVQHFDDITGKFDSLISYIRDKEDMPGNFGRYLTENFYYAWNFVKFLSSKDHLVWKIPACGTNYYHKTGTAGALILLEWISDSGFSFNIDF